MTTIQIINDADGCPAVLIDGSKVAELAHDQQVSIQVGAEAAPTVVTKVGEVTASSGGDGD